MYFQSDSGSFYYEVHGKAGAPAIAFTHGGGLHSGMFESQVSALSDRFLIITWDMQGHGRSARLTGNLDVPKMADTLLAILSETGVADAVLVGQSLGVWVSQHAASRQPQRVRALVSIGGLPIDGRLSGVEMILFRIGIPVTRLLPAGWVFRKTAKEKATTPHARQFFEESLRHMGKQQFIWMLAGQLDACDMKVPATPDVPLLITHGEHEMPKSLVKANREWHAAVDGSRYYEIAGAGHNANQDNPESFNAILTQFMHELEKVE